MGQFNVQVHPEWQGYVEEALSTMDAQYLESLQGDETWLPGSDALLSAFRMPLSSTRYILFGESPYPRAQSANGYAFWDNAVDTLWSETGLSKAVNRATSLRNFIKMLLFARGDLVHDFSQPAIASLDKSQYVQTASELFNALIHKGFLLLNASLVYSPDKVLYHARQWRPFINSVLRQLVEKKTGIQLVLFGRIAEKISEAHLFPSLLVEHPYNISFITNPKVVSFFKPMNLLANHHD